MRGSSECPSLTSLPIMYQVSLIVPLKTLNAIIYVFYFFFFFAYMYSQLNRTPLPSISLICLGACRVEGQCLLVVYLRGSKSGIGRDGMGGGGCASQNERWALMAKLSRQHITDWMVSDVFCRETCFCLLFLPPESTVYWVGYLDSRGRAAESAGHQGCNQ